MTFKKGFSGNKKGRPTGAKDKNQSEIKKAYQDLIDGNLKNIEKWLNIVADKNPEKALDFLLRLSEFVIPKMRAMEQTLSTEDDLFLGIIQRSATVPNVEDEI